VLAGCERRTFAEELDGEEGEGAKVRMIGRELTDGVNGGVSKRD
jgi:hypothetical protein